MIVCCLTQTHNLCIVHNTSIKVPIRYDMKVLWLVDIQQIVLFQYSFLFQLAILSTVIISSTKHIYCNGTHKETLNVTINLEHKCIVFLISGYHLSNHFLFSLLAYKYLNGIIPVFFSYSLTRMSNCFHQDDVDVNGIIVILQSNHVLNIDFSVCSTRYMWIYQFTLTSKEVYYEMMLSSTVCINRCT